MTWPPRDYYFIITNHLNLMVIRALRNATFECCPVFIGADHANDFAQNVIVSVVIRCRFGQRTSELQELNGHMHQLTVRMGRLKGLPAIYAFRYKFEG